MKDLILCDVDETVLLFADGFQHWLEQRGVFSDKRLRDNYYFEHTFNIPDDEGMVLVNEFSESSAMSNLQPEKCAAQVLPRLYNRGYRFVAITACANTPDIVVARTKNLQDAFGFKWESVHCVGLRASKIEKLQLYPSAIWVEDNYKHAIDGANLGHRTYLLRREYNKHHVVNENIRAVNDWHDIEKDLED